MSSKALVIRREIVVERTRQQPGRAASAAKVPRQRHDAFNAARKRAYLDALSTAGSILGACRETGVSNRTVYNHQRSDSGFLRLCGVALRTARPTAERLGGIGFAEGGGSGSGAGTPRDSV